MGEGGIVDQAKALLSIAEVLDPFSDEQRLAILSSACSAFGLHDPPRVVRRSTKGSVSKAVLNACRGDWRTTGEIREVVSHGDIPQAVYYLLRTGRLERRETRSGYEYRAKEDSDGSR